MTPLDVLAVGWAGVAGRPGRAVLSALGIALGMATLVLVTAIPASGRADLERQLSALGADVLVAQASGALTGGDAPPAAFSPDAAAMARRIGPVTSAAAVANLNLRVTGDVLADPNTTAAVSALAATPELLEAVRGRVAEGTFLSPATVDLPTVVLGHDAARWLGITAIDPLRPPRIDVGGTDLTVVGVLAPTPLTPELDQAALVGWGAAVDLLGFDGRPGVVYLRAVESQVEAVRAVLPATLDPALPGLVSVSRPSDALAASRAAQGTLSGLLLGLAGVALAVGALGIANTMVVSVLERRRDIGLRRALGATRRDVRRQFVVEAVALALLGGAGGMLLGALGAVAYALVRGWPPVVPVSTMAAGLLGAVVVGVVAGLHPAVQAARLSPTVALATA